MTMQRRGEYSEPQSGTVPSGSGGPYAKKYVRIPVDVMKHVIMPAASDAASQTLNARNVPKGQRFGVYHKLLSVYLERGIEIYRKNNGETTVTTQGILSEGTPDIPALR